MSSMTLSPSVARVTRLGNRAHFALLGLATVLAAALANALVFYAADPFVAYDQRFEILNSAAPAISMTVMFAVPAVLLYAALRRYASNPARLYTSISAVVFVLTLVPDFTIAPQHGRLLDRADRRADPDAYRRRRRDCRDADQAGPPD